MSIHLVGGWSGSGDRAEVLAPFVAEAAARAARSVGTGGAADAGGAAPAGLAPELVVLLVSAGAEADAVFAEEYRAALAAAGAPSPRIVQRRPEEGFALADLVGAHGILVGGGRTPDYLRAVQPIVLELRRLVADGLPYLGLSAGAMIAAERAIAGGSAIGGVPVSPEAWNEGLDEVALEPGIGLVDLTVEVHAAQAGTLSRLVAVVEAQLADGGVALDEDTALIVGEGPLRVAGSGSVWTVRSGDDGVIVRTLGA